MVHIACRSAFSQSSDPTSSVKTSYKGEGTKSAYLHRLTCFFGVGLVPLHSDVLFTGSDSIVAAIT